MGALSAALKFPTPLAVNMPSCPHAQIHLQLFIAVDLRSSISTGSNLFRIKVSVLKLVNDFLLMFLIGKDSRLHL